MCLEFVVVPRQKAPELFHGLRADLEEWTAKYGDFFSSKAFEPCKTWRNWHAYNKWDREGRFNWVQDVDLIHFGSLRRELILLVVLFGHIIKYCGVWCFKAHMLERIDGKSSALPAPHPSRVPQNGRRL